MHSQTEALVILGCSRDTLSQYVKAGKIKRHKKGRNSFYDEREVALLLPEITEKRKKFRPDLPDKVPEKKEPTKKPDAKPTLSFDHNAQLLDDYGLEVMARTTREVEALGIFKEIDRPAIEQYAFHMQEAHKYAIKANEEDSIAMGAMGGYTVHPYHRVMKDHQKQAQFYMDRLGLTPLARRKLEVDDSEKKPGILDALDDE